VYFYNLWQLQQYQFFVVLIAVIGGLFYRRWDRDFNFPSTPFQVSLALLGLITGTLGCILWSPWLAFFSFATCLSSFFATCREKSLTVEVEPISNGSLLYLSLAPWICLRLPLGLDDRFIQYLQHITARLSSYILDLLSIPHQISGVIFELASGKLFVEEACSGVQSLFALLCVAMLLMAIHYRPILLLPIYALAGVFSAILLNIIRVTSIAIALEWFQYDLAHGVVHDILGYACLTLSITLLLSFDRLFQVIFYPISDDNNPLANQLIPNPFQLTWNRFLAPIKRTQTIKSLSSRQSQFLYWIAIGLCSIGWIFQLSQSVQSLRSSNTLLARERDTNQLWSPPESLFASDKEFILEGYEQSRDGKDVSQAKYVDIWKLSDNSKNIHYRVAISQPYDHFHDLNACYYALGWNSSKSEIIKKIEASDPSIENWPFILSKWMNPNGNYAYLSYSAISEDGTPVLPPSEDLLAILGGRLTFKIDPTLIPKNCFLFQIWTTLDAPLSAEEELNLKRMHVKLRERVKEAYVQGLVSSKSNSTATVTSP
jgi:exosortase